MKTAAVICECNPLHNGHAYLFRELRRLAKADYVLAIMSGNFVQRGEPAVYDKFTRAKMVLLAGADAVLELPPLFAMSSAREFAMAGVRTAAATGIVDVLGFGAEGTAEAGGSHSLLHMLHQAAACLQFEDAAPVQAALRAELKKGLSYPAARSQAFSAFLTQADPEKAAVLSALLKQPNNILALEYLRALNLVALQEQNQTMQKQAEEKQAFGKQGGQDRTGSEQARPFLRQSSPASHKMEAMVIQRIGDAYHSPQPKDVRMTSATALRRFLRSEEARQSGTLLKQLASYCPEAVLPVFAKAPKALSPDSISLLLNAAILAETGAGAAGTTAETEVQNSFCRFADVSEALSNRLLRQTGLGCFSQRVQQLKTRQYTQLRIQRALLHIALGVTEEEVCAAKKAGYVRYLRLLGFRRQAAPLLRAIKEISSLPLVTKPAAAKELLARDSQLDQLYYALRAVSPETSAALLAGEFSRSPVILD